MKCIYCKEKAGFMKRWHDECFSQTKKALNLVENIVNQYNQSCITAKVAKKELIEISKSDILYTNYLESKIYDKTLIPPDETIIYIETGISILESKNRCKMLSTGYRYEKKPVWNESNILIGQNVEIIFTDKRLYMVLNQNTMMYTYNKIINYGFDKKYGYTYFDVKTTSPFRHRFSIKPFFTSETNKLENICLFIHCFKG